MATITLFDKRSVSLYSYAYYSVRFIHPMPIYTYRAKILHTAPCVFLHPTTLPPPWKYTSKDGAESLSHAAGVYTVTGIPPK